MAELNRHRLRLGLIALWLLHSTAVQADQHIRALAASCASCHGTHGNSAGAMPSLAGMDPSRFKARMQAFRSGKGASTVMHHLSKGLTLAEIEQMSVFFAKQPQIPAQLPPHPGS